MQKKIKPCPLCGNKNIYIGQEDNWNPPYPVMVCDSADCNLIADFDSDVSSEKKLIKRWNRRPIVAS